MAGTAPVVRVFVTGASGLVGAAAARALLAAGHEVAGLARSSATADGLRAMGIEPVAGDLRDPTALRYGAEWADAVVHAAFPRDAYQNLSAAIELDQVATGVFLDILRGTTKPFVYTSGISVAADTHGVVTEQTPIRTPPHMQWRRDLELAALDSGGVVARPTFVYGRASGEILVTLIRDAAERGAAYYADDGDNAWPNVHIDDLGRAYALAVERAPAGTVVNLTGGETTPCAVMEAIGRLIGHPEATRSLPLAEAADVVPYIRWLGGDIRVDSGHARRLLGWRPEGPNILDDIEHGSYRSLIDRSG